MALFGLIGRKLGHSFSKNYFENKFLKEGLQTHRYELFELENIDQIQSIFDKHDLKGLNVTIPYKESVLPFLDDLDESAQKVGAVNVIKRDGQQFIGYNSDYYGFKTSLRDWLPTDVQQALVLGTGGAAKAVVAALEDLQINSTLVSRSPAQGAISYEKLHSGDLLGNTPLIINTTPLGMSPNLDSLPDLPYEQFRPTHFAYDLVYNPEETAFLKQAKAHGARTKNGLEMLHLQAEKSWEIWNS